jgi:hypothetical protein
MEGIDRETRPAGREVEVFVFGDNADEIELAALAAARAFFGDDAHLTVVPAYKAMAVLPGYSLEKQAGGKKHHAQVIVRTIEPMGGQS